MVGKKTSENSPAKSTVQKANVIQRSTVSGNPIQGRASSPKPSDNIALKNKSTKQEAISGEENGDVHALKANEPVPAHISAITEVVTKSRECQLNNSPKADSKRENQRNGTGKERIPSSSVGPSAVARATSPSPKRPIAFAGEISSDKNVNTSKNGPKICPSPATGSRSVGKLKGKAKEQDPRFEIEIENTLEKACQKAATDQHRSWSSSQPSPGKSTIELYARSTPSSKSAGRSTNNVMDESTPASGKPAAQTIRGGNHNNKTKNKRKTSALDDEPQTGGRSSESDTSSSLKQPVVPGIAAGKRPMAAAEVSVKHAVMGRETKGQSSKGRGTSGWAQSSANEDGSKPTTIDNVCNVKATASKNGWPARGDQSPGDSGSEEAFTALGSGQGPTFAKAVNKTNQSRFGKTGKRLKRHVDAKVDSPIFENNTKEIYEKPGSEDDMNDHSMISIADIPSDDELGVEKIEEIFGRYDVPDSRKLEHIKAIMIKQNQIIARKTQMINTYLKENEALQERIEEFDSSILTQEEDSNEQQEQIDKLKAMVDEFQRQVQSQESFIEIAERDKSRLEEELKSRAMLLKNTEKDRKTLKESVSKMAKDMVQMKNDMDQLISEKHGYLATIRKCESERDMLLCQLHHGPTQLENARLESELLEKSTELVVANQRLKDLQMEFTALRKREKKEQGKRTPSALSTELLLLVDGKEEWEPCIEQGSVERNPFASLPSPVITRSAFQFGEPTYLGNREEKCKNTYQNANSFLCETEETAQGSGSLACLNARAQAEIPADTSSSTRENKLGVLGISTQTRTQSHTKLDNDNDRSTQANAVGMLEASAEMITGTVAHELEMFEASTQTMSTSTQIGEMGVLEASTQTDPAAGIHEMRNSLVQPVTLLPESGIGWRISHVLMMLVWVVIIIWGHKEDQQLWLNSNGVSRVAILGIRDRSLGPFLWLEQLRYDLMIWLQVDRVLPG